MDHEVHSNGSGGHEYREANLKLILYSAIGLAVAVAAVMLLMWGTFNMLKTEVASNEQGLSPLTPPGQLPPEPRLEEHPSQSMRALREQEDQVLGGYHWQDEKAGTVRIPIDRAIDLIAQRGLPVLNQQPAQSATPAAKAPRESQAQGVKPSANQ